MARMLGRIVKRMGKLAAIPAALLGVASVARAQHDGAACGDCGRGHCPPAFKHVAEKHPRVRVHRGCAKPVCNPCNLPNWGYYATCWNRWPHPDDQAHCRPTSGLAVMESAVSLTPAAAPAPTPSALPVIGTPSSAPSAAPTPQALLGQPVLPQRNPPPGARPLRPGEL